MTITNAHSIIDLTEEERKAIETTKRLMNEIYWSLSDDEENRFDACMQKVWKDKGNGTPEVRLVDLTCFLDHLQENIENFNRGDHSK